MKTAEWLGVARTSSTISQTSESHDSRILGAETDQTIQQVSAFQAALLPVAKTSLGFVKSISPESYAEVSKVTILDTNDVMELNTSGSITPELPINLPSSSLLQVGSIDLVENLNSQFLQGMQPGTNVGDIAIVTAPQPTPTAVTGLPTATTQPITGLTNSNLSGAAGITNANLASSAVTVNTSGPLSGGGEVSLGGVLTLSCPTCATSSSSLFSATSTDTLTNKTIDLASNTLTGITASNLTAGDFSSKITSGTYSISITGSVGSATNFTGSLAGDVTGSQSATTVAKINGTTLGTTTATSGNILIGDGSQWVTRALSSDATVSSTGVLTLKSVGTAGSYGSATAVPVITTDAQGRVSGVTATTIAGLTTAHFSSANISQWTNNSGFITTSSSDILTNKTISGASNTFTNIANSSLTNSGLTFAGNSGSGTVSLGGTLTVLGSGINNAVYSGSTITITGTEADTLATVTGRGATTTTAVTLSNSANAVTAGTLTATGGTINGTTIGASTPSSGVFTTVNGLTVTNNGSNTLNIATGKTLTVNNSLTFTGTDGTIFVLPTTSDDLVGRTVTQTLTNKTIDLASNTLTGITASSLTAGDFSSKITSGTYSINISGNAATATLATTATTATNFSGSLAGDVTGTQGSTVVGKINGAVLGTTTATLANILIGDGSQWVTRALSSDATITSTGVLTLKNTGTAGSYGSATAIPVITTDAQGRVSGVTATTIAGLTNSHLSGTAGITNANLANSSISTAGNSGSGSVSLGGGLTFTGAGITTTSASGSTLTFTSTEADTLAAVTGRGATTSTALTLNGGITTTTTTALTLDSGTTGAISIGTGASAKTITIGNTTGATALNFNSGTGNINFTVDGTGTSGRVQIGNSATATPDLLVLDNGTADPIGVNGGMYYNTTSNKFRCYENGAWANCITPAGSDVQSAASYDTTEALTNIASSQVTITSVSVTPTAATGDVYIRAKAEILSSNATDQSLVLSIEDDATCTGATLATNTLTITSAAGTVIGDFELAAIEVDAGAALQSYSFCASTATGDTDIRFYEMFATVIDTGADLAEIYTTSDDTIEVGDVVSLDSTLQTGMKKSQVAYDKSVLGIISTRPGLVIGSVEKEGVAALPIALSGRVPVKVSTQNGKIVAGDYLTTSSIPGVAMKATKSGAIIGTAMTSFEGEGIGKILAFVKNGSANGIEESEEETSISSENVLDEVTAQINIEQQVAQIIADVFKNTIEFFSKVIFYSDVNFLGRPTFNKDTAGHAFIPAGQTEVIIPFENEYDNNPVVTVSVNLTGEARLDGLPGYAVYDVTTKDFKIKLSQPAALDINFSWIALAVSGEVPPISHVTTPTAVPESIKPLQTAIPTPELQATPTPLPSHDVSPIPQATDSAEVDTTTENTSNEL